MAYVVITAAIVFLSFLYALAGQAGGTAFLAVMALASFPASDMRPTALILNVAAAGYATWRLDRSHLVDWPKLIAFALPSLPFAVAGGLTTLGGPAYFGVTGSLLVAAATLMIVGGPSGETGPTISPHRLWIVAAGVAIGFLSGLTGIGGGVFLAPLLITLGWATPRQAACLAPPYILANSIVGLGGVLAAGQSPSPATLWFVAAVVVGAAAGTAASQRWMSEARTKYLISAIVCFAGLRLLASSLLPGI